MALRTLLTTLALTVVLQLGATRSTLANPMDVIDGLGLWLRADALGLTTNDPVGTWTDSSTFGRDATAADSPTDRRPTYVDSVSALNNMPAVRFDGATQRMTIADQILPNDPTEMEVFAVAQTNDSSDFAVFVLRNGSTNRFIQLDQNNSKVRFILRDSAGRTLNAGSPTALSVGGHGIFAGRLSTSGSQATAVAALNGTEGTPASDTFNTTGLGAFTQTIGGIDNYGPAWWNGDIAEVLVFDRQLNPIERNHVGYYLGAKYGFATDYAGGIRIDYQASGSHTHPGFLNESVGTTTSAVKTAIDPFGDGNDIDVTLSVSSGNIQGRNRGDMTNLTDWDPLCRDLVFNNGGGDMTLLVEDLPGGLYEFRGFFNDSYSYDGSVGLSEYGVEVYLGDATSGKSMGSTLVSDVRNSNLGGNDDLGIVRFKFNHLSAGDLVLTLVGTGSLAAPLDHRFAFNGFMLTATVPEPSSVMLLLVGLVSVLTTHRRRR